MIRLQSLTSRLSQALWLGPFLAALGLRLAFLDLRPLWYDEAFSVLLARRGWEGIATATWRALLQGQPGEFHSPFYYLLLSLWIRVFGDEEVAVRMMSVVFGLAAWIMTWILAHRWLPRKAAYLGAWMAALSPFQVHYAQEARMYSLLNFTALSALLAFERALEKPRLRRWIVAGICGGLLLYSHNAAVLYLFSWGFVWLIQASRQGQTRSLIITMLGAGLMFLPWAWLIQGQAGYVQRKFWIPKPGLREGINTLLGFTVHVPVFGWQAGLSLAVSLLLALMALHITLRHGREKPYLARPLIFLLGPWLTIFFFSQWMPIYLIRLLLPIGALYLLWLAGAMTMTQVPQRIRQSLIVAWLVGCGIGLYTHWTYQGFPYAPYKEIGTWLKTQYRSNEWVLHSNKITYLPLMYTTPELPQGYLPDPPGSGGDILFPAIRAGLGIPPPVTLNETIARASGVWFLIFPREIQDYARAGRPHPYLTWLRDRFCLQTRTQWGEMWIMEFRPCSRP